MTIEQRRELQANAEELKKKLDRLDESELKYADILLQGMLIHKDMQDEKPKN